MSVLIVEDNLISAKVLEHTLGKHGYKTVTARDGKQALECLELHPDIELVITDMLMPRIDGAQFIRKLRECSEWSDIPVLVCTSLTTSAVNGLMPEHNWKFMMKPISAERLVPKVEELLAYRKPAWQNPFETMSKIGLEPDAFFSVIDQFLGVVKKKIILLEEHIRTASEEPLDLQDPTEGATLLRAERVMHIPDRFPQDTNGIAPEALRAVYRLLLRESKTVQHHLTEYSAG